MSNNANGSFMFCDGSKIYKKFNKFYKKHKEGYVILGPPCIGKTRFVKNQKGMKKNWIDQDDLYNELGVKWRYNEKNKNDFKLNYLRADYMSEQSKLLGYRVIGALFWEYIPNAIVIPPLKLHKKYLSYRFSKPQCNCKCDSYKNILNIRKILSNHAKKNKIPVFNSVEDAVNYLENL